MERMNEIENKLLSGEVTNENEIKELCKEYDEILADLILSQE